MLLPRTHNTKPSGYLFVLLAILMLSQTISQTMGGTRSDLTPGELESDGATAVLAVLNVFPGLSASCFPKELRHAPVAVTLCAAEAFTIVAVWRRLTSDGLNGPLPERSLLLTPTFASYL